MLCNLQIFSGGVCHLEQLHAQSPFLFPIVFSIKAGPPPLDLSFWSFLTFLHHGIEEVGRHLL